jgi:hypothetical protein
VAEHFNTNHHYKETIKKTMAKGIQALPNFRQLDIRDFIYYQNIGRTFHYARSSYIPSVKINTPIHFFKASQSKFKEKAWINYCQHPIEFHIIEGNHFSIFQSPGVVLFAQIFNRIMENRHSYHQSVEKGTKQ